MNTKTLKGITAAASLLIGIGAASPALATFTLPAPQFLGAAPNSIDVWTFSCPAGTVSAIARVYDTAAVFNAAALMQVVLGEDGTPFPSAQATDLNPAANGEGGGPSPYAVVPFDGLGLQYAMAFKKTAGGADSYMGEAYCVIGGGALGGVIGLTKRIDQ